MPSYRIGFGSDFNLRDAKVGIGTTLGRTKLDVVGVSKADFNISGVSTLTSYAGLVGQKQNIIDATVTGVNTTGVGTFVQVNETQTGFENLSGDFTTVSEDIIVDEGRIFQVSSGSTVSVGTLEHVSIGTHFSVPRGGIAVRPREPREGMVRFNDDLNTLEFYNGVEWRQFTVTGASGRGVWAGGYNVSASPSTATAGISYIQISTLGNSVNFGSLTTAGQDSWGCSSSTRGLFGGRFNGNAIEYITIASEGNSIDFGDLAQTTGGTNYACALSSSTRGIWAGGIAAAPISAEVNIIQYVTIATIGNTLDFGDLTKTATPNGGGLSSPTRGLFAVSGTTGDSSLINAITIASTGNAVEFGNLTTRNGFTNAPGFSNSIRGIWGSRSSGGITNTIDYVTISTFGNAVDFGDSTTSGQGGGAVASSIRGVFCVGLNPSLSGSERDQNVLNYVTIATTGNAIDFGDLIRGGNSYSRHTGPVSDSHGGLGGF